MTGRLLLDSFQSARAALWAKKMRSALSMLGVIIGILTISSLLTISFGVREQITSSISDLGANLIVVLPGDINQEGSFASQLGASTLTEADVAAIRAGVSDARNLNSIMLVSGAVRAGNTTLPSAFILAASPGIAQTMNIKIAHGRFLDENDELQHARHVVLGAGGAEKLFGTSPALGQELEIRGERYEVVGILEKVSGAGASFGGPDMNSIVIVPLATGWEITGTRQIFRISMQAPTAERVDSMKQDVERIVLANHRGEKDFSVVSQDDLLELTGDILDLLTAMISALAAISLVVGGIGIMNIMLVSVSERTREIGIRKAIGATRGAIMLQFLIESIMLTFLAGVIAVAVFSGAIAALSSRSPIPLSLDARVIVIALGFSILAGIAFGMIPAWQASKKDPIEALRYE